MNVKKRKNNKVNSANPIYFYEAERPVAGNEKSMFCKINELRLHAEAIRGEGNSSTFLKYSLEYQVHPHVAIDSKKGKKLTRAHESTFTCLNE